jgi:hypothetical protein
VPEPNNLPPVKTPVHRVPPSSLVQQLARQQTLKAEILADPLLPMREAKMLLGNPCISLLRKWVKNGTLKTWRVGPRGHFKVRLSEIRRLIALGDSE